jgi:hypothetical protein
MNPFIARWFHKGVAVGTVKRTLRKGDLRSWSQSSTVARTGERPFSVECRPLPVISTTLLGTSAPKETQKHRNGAEEDMISGLDSSPDS